MDRIYQTVLLLFLFTPTTWAVSDSNVDELIAAYQQSHGFSGSVLVVEEGEVTLSRATGLANEETREPITMNTRFDIGSIQKNLTAVLVLQLIDQELVKLNDTLDTFALELSDPRANNITIQYLLEHTSGFRDIFTAEYRENPSRYNTLEKKFALLQREPLLFSPGEDRRYSNYGYIVLGVILEKITGKDYWTLVEERLLDHSRQALASLEVNSAAGNSAIPYHFKFDGVKVAISPEQVETPSPDGGGEMSVFELYGFYHQLFNARKLLSPESLQVFQSMQENEEQWLSFGGGAGVSTAVELDFANDTWVLVLANTDRLVAEMLSSRLRSYVVNGEYASVKQPPETFTYQFFQSHGAENFNRQFESVYKESGYQVFIGRVVTNLARELVASNEAEGSIFFFEYLTRLFSDVPDVYDGLAFGHFSAGDQAKAREAFAIARELEPEYNSQFNAENFDVSVE